MYEQLVEVWREAKELLSVRTATWVHSGGKCKQPIFMKKHNTGMVTCHTVCSKNFDNTFVQLSTRTSLLHDSIQLSKVLQAVVWMGRKVITWAEPIYHPLHLLYLLSAPCRPGLCLIFLDYPVSLGAPSLQRPPFWWWLMLNGQSGNNITAQLPEGGARTLSVIIITVTKRGAIAWSRLLKTSFVRGMASARDKIMQNFCRDGCEVEVSIFFETRSECILPLKHLAIWFCKVCSVEWRYEPILGAKSLIL